MIENAEKPNSGGNLNIDNKRKFLLPLSKERKGRCRITGAMVILEFTKKSESQEVK